MGYFKNAVIDNINYNDLEALREVAERLEIARTVLNRDVSEYNEAAKSINARLWQIESYVMEEIYRLDEVIVKEILAPGSSDLDRIVAGWVRESREA